MPITRYLVAQDENDVNQWLKVDHPSRYIVNDSPEWQFLFGVDSALNTSQFVLKIACRFDDDSLTKLKMVGYLYNPLTAAIGSIDTCEFNVYLIDLPDWTETFVDVFSGVLQPNNYFYVNPDITDVVPGGMDGSATIMIECVAVRLGTTYRDRIYVNHLGIYDNVLRLKQDIQFSELTKVDE